MVVDLGSRSLISGKDFRLADTLIEHTSLKPPHTTSHCNNLTALTVPGAASLSISLHEFTHESKDPPPKSLNCCDIPPMICRKAPAWQVIPTSSH